MISICRDYKHSRTSILGHQELADWWNESVLCQVPLIIYLTNNIFCGIKINHDILLKHWSIHTCIEIVNSDKNLRAVISAPRTRSTLWSAPDTAYPPGLLNYQQLFVVFLFITIWGSRDQTRCDVLFPTIDISFKALFGFSCFFCLHKSPYLFECTQYGLSSSIRIKPGCSSCLRKQTLRDRENRLNKIDSIFAVTPFVLNHQGHANIQTRTINI